MEWNGRKQYWKWIFSLNKFRYTNSFLKRRNASHPQFLPKDPCCTLNNVFPPLLKKLKRLRWLLASYYFVLCVTADNTCSDLWIHQQVQEIKNVSGALLSFLPLSEESSFLERIFLFRPRFPFLGSPPFSPSTPSGPKQLSACLAIVFWLKKGRQMLDVGCMQWEVSEQPPPMNQEIH